MESKEQILKEYGLSDNEVKVYLASLSLGTSKVNEISKKGRMLRTTTYEVLKALVEQGLVSYVIKSGVRYFEAADPGKLVSILEERKRGIKSIMPELQSLMASVTEKPAIEVYEGRAGLKTILDDIINSKPEEILTLSSSKILETLTYYFPQWIRRRVKAGIYARILQQEAMATKKLKRKDRAQLREIRFLPKEFKINTHIQIYGSKVAILTLRKDSLIGVIIENKDIAETQRSLFDVLWNSRKHT
jgi:sugar-specific transcriptional regulator TrmB